MKTLLCTIILSCFPFTVCFADEGVTDNKILEPVVLEHFGTPLKYCNTYSMGTADNSNTSTNDGFLIAKNGLFGITKYLARTIFESKRATGFVQFLSAQNIPCDQDIREKDFLYINLKNEDEPDSYFVKMNDDGLYFSFAQKENISNNEHIFQFININKNQIKSTYALRHISSHSTKYLSCFGLNYCVSTEIPSQVLLIRFLPVRSGIREKADIPM
ncbi:hypothetical protein [Fluviispira sanaruensis]|uniref:Uncharacterized protein n=1 Tax=Fluviispira sanaruensis TaxID=2493639 RepID=A0A4P2VMK8_FLUSA|nr:hypothetical protein [Fluviispira sanaruensis]BBH52699.1 hypothetical protein JCM31447_11410 [Fluviispira sanaruensis]